MYTYIYYTIYIYTIYIHRYILAYIQPAPRYSRICYTRTNRYDCVSLGSLVPPLSFFFLSVHIYIYRIHVPYLFLVLPFRSSFSKVPSLFFHPYPSFVLVIEAIFQLAGLTRADLLSARQREKERESFRETVYRITEPLCEREREQGESGPVDATELMAASRRLHGQLNLTPIYAEATKINMAYFELPRETSHGFVRIPLETAANR